jgi:hypothetical protein
MKLKSPCYFSKIYVLVFLFAIGFGYGQKQSTKTLFGKQISTQNRIPKNGYIRCASVEYNKLLQEKNPNKFTDSQFEAWITPLVNKYKLMRTNEQIGGIITIPVVVHVIYNGQAIGVAPNITDEQVESQITVLNQDYRKMAGTNGDNTNPVGADTQIQFALAKQDPNGNPTDGIDRVSLDQESWSDLDINYTVKPATIWDPTQYMNMWSVKFSDNTLLGYSQFPEASGLIGIDYSNGNANSDGVVSNYTVFGSKDYDNGTFLLNPIYNLGRTITHEVGHWLGLRHIWGDSTCGNDYCADTPIHHDANYDCPSPIPLSCDPIPVNEMIENYMDYTDDSCMNIFTKDQKDRMITVMNNSPRRKELKNSTKNIPIPLYAIDAEVKLEETSNSPICGLFPNQTIQKIVIFNRGTTNLTSAILNYSINGGVHVSYNWQGNLPTNKSSIYEITINSISNGTINVSIDKPNGVLDEKPTNNSTTGNFVIPTLPTNYPFTNYVFRLQQDYWGSETTWSLKNSSGIIVHSGGPYIDTYINESTISKLPDLITENWSLSANECYTFTINDAAGDGICCGTGYGSSGDGFYEIISEDGLAVKSGKSFGSIETFLFTTNSQDKNAFKNSKEIYIYPNPAKEILNIRIPTYFGFPNKYVIYNILGQMVTQKEITFEPDLTVNTSDLNSGYYFISLFKQSEQKTLKFIKE